MPFWVLVLGGVLLFLSAELFLCVFCCVFFSFWCLFRAFLGLGAGRRAALFSAVLFGCVFFFVFSSFFMKAILSFFDFLVIFWVPFFFFSFLL